ncbi:MAG: hypothetical protein ACP5HQ_01445 [Thermoprotei archaeon]
MRFFNVDYVRDVYNEMLKPDVNNTISGNAREALKTITLAMELKSKTLSQLTIKEESDARKLFESVFYAKKHLSDVLSQTGLRALAEAYETLKDSSLPYLKRVERFASTVRGGDRADIEDMAKEVIHFLEPERYPLWTRWVWNGERKTGAVYYLLKEKVDVHNFDEFLQAMEELRSILSIFGMNHEGKFYLTSVFSVYTYVRYLDYTTHLAVDKKAAGLLPSHLTTTALVLGLKPYLKVIRLANSGA